MKWQMFKNPRIPIWINVFMLILILFMTTQVYWFYFNHQYLIDAGISIKGVPDLNVMYTTASRLVAMIAVTIFVLITQNPKQYLVVLLLSIFREGQEMFIDPLFPYTDGGPPPIVDFGLHVIIVALEVWAFLILYIVTHKRKLKWRFFPTT